uniref:DUF4110 domain-containing protein n=1 Tax=Aegilops tauschii subsp. strangulata TaxID=200361 RepID=A0A453C8V3_AEGTS
MYWQMAAYEHTQHTGKELRKDGFDLAETRFKELKPILDESWPCWRLNKRRRKRPVRRLVPRKTRRKANRRAREDSFGSRNGA